MEGLDAAYSAPQDTSAFNNAYANPTDADIEQYRQQVVQEHKTPENKAAGANEPSQATDRKPTEDGGGESDGPVVNPNNIIHVNVSKMNEFLWGLQVKKMQKQ